MHKPLMFVLVLLLSSVASFAQSDSIAGAWGGELKPANSSRPIALTLDLKVDGKGAITGTATGFPDPAEVKTGTFDSKTGALKLQLGKKGEAAVQITLEGTVAKEAVSGTFSGGGRTGTFKLTRK
jgi:hypothetical protein